jgi:hypothetical protein
LCRSPYRTRPQGAVGSAETDYLGFSSSKLSTEKMKITGLLSLFAHSETLLLKIVGNSKML